MWKCILIDFALRFIIKIVFFNVICLIVLIK